MVLDRFSNATEPSGIPQGWEVLEFKKIERHTTYQVLYEDGNFFVKAVSHNSASGIFRLIQVDPKEYPILSWKWKVEKLVKKSNPRAKEGDDYPARIYVAFKYNPKQASFLERAKYGAAKTLYRSYPPKGALNYIWATDIPKNTGMNNVYTDRAKMVAVQSGPEFVGSWMQEERNIYEDYKQLFGEEPPEIEFIAIMTDTDDTGESATAYYDDIILRKR
jgi:hypothetical protein